MPYRKLYGDGGADYVNEYSRGWRLDAREVPAGPISQFAVSDRRADPAHGRNRVGPCRGLGKCRIGRPYRYGCY